jgi:hypothetical protein
MRKSILSIVIIIFIVTITIVAVVSTRTWFLLNNKSQFTSEVNGLSIALIKPTFTAAAYHKSFYKFYFLYSSIPLHARKNITSDLNLLSSPVYNLLTRSSSASSIRYLTTHLRTPLPKSNTHVLTDEDVDGGSIFSVSGSNKYDILILGHQEYVTQQEYDNLKRFVANGGTMILLDGNVFYAQVKYDRHTHTITLVKGHGWAYNGKSAWKSVRERWANETSEWVGSNYLCFSCSAAFPSNPFHYSHHEEQYLTNPNDLILLNYNASVSKEQGMTLDPVIATYTLDYQKGKVIALSIYSDDIMTNSKFTKYFDSLLLQYASRPQL